MANLSELVLEHLEKQQKVNKKLKIKAKLTLGKPATDAEIDACEKKLKVKFPPSYREFLRLHNGYVGFEGAMDLTDLKVLSSAAPAKKMNALWGKSLDVKYSVFVFGMRAKQLAYPVAFFDMKKQTAKGEAPIVYLQSPHTKPEITANFTAFLKKRIRDLDKIK